MHGSRVEISAHLIVHRHWHDLPTENESLFLFVAMPTARLPFFFLMEKNTGMYLMIIDLIMLTRRLPGRNIHHQ
jgi:hypothetical protein